MAGNPDVLALLEEMLDSGRTPEEVCRDCPELLPEVRRRWTQAGSGPVGRLRQSMAFRHCQSRIDNRRWKHKCCQ